ncbi:hypothetical protein ACH4E7_33135 [Kitasatospora sp. NPDC018058]|uniref:hypothetical protein n=1 Tax=Kitasatospora sp. NPDC018058 TaxID=3364025 RepID=UPI0037C19119
MRRSRASVNLGGGTHTLDGDPVETLDPARAAFKDMLRGSAWDAPHLGYFLGYACWNYFTTPTTPPAPRPAPMDRPRRSPAYLRRTAAAGTVKEVSARLWPRG